MPGGKFNLPKSAQNRALAAEAAAGHIPVAAPAPSPNELLAALKGGGNVDPQILMAILAMLAGMGPQGVPGMQGQGQPMMPGGEQGMAPGGSPIEAALGGY